MQDINLKSIYNMVCEAPSGDGFGIEYLPDLFSVDSLFDKPHVHTFYEIIWFFEAGGYHTVDFTDYPIEANSLFFLSPGQVHCFDGNLSKRGVTMKFCTDFLKDEKADEDIFIKYNIFNAFDKAPYCVINDTNAVGYLKDIIARMEEEMEHKQTFGHLDMLRSMVKIFLINVHRYGVRKESEALDTIKPSHSLFVMFRQTLEREYTRLHTVKEYADELNVSSKTLSNSVTECSGKAPLAFINDRILLEAKRMLRYTDMMVKEIAYRLGYDDPSYFVKFFKRQVGYLPKEWREEQ